MPEGTRYRYDVGRFLKKSDLYGQPVGGRDIIGIVARDKRRITGSPAPVQCINNAAIFLTKHNHSGVFRRDFGKKIRSRVRRSIINQYNSDRLVSFASGCCVSPPSSVEAAL